ncbi:hypothetical protein CK934_08965 [Chitinophaga sp. MD30]|nr:hypothetical protein CK934_08965 [Chitinophaga sp. MD30]
MAYTDKNKQRIIAEVRKLFYEHKRDGVSTKYVFDNFIYPRFFITMPTFYRYMSPNREKNKPPNIQLPLIMA